ncbi:MAG: hypothetical protein AB7I30_06960 [Isosphaeraceae bacterium]
MNEPISSIARRFRGHGDGCFWNLIATRALRDHLAAVLAELARRGQVGTDAEGEPLVTVHECEAFLGDASIAIEVPVPGLSPRYPLRVNHRSGGGSLIWTCHSVRIGLSPASWRPLDTVESVLTPVRLRAAYQGFLGRPAPASIIPNEERPR